MFSKIKDKKGFSFVDILIGVAIIALIAGIASLTWGSTLDNADMTKARMDMKTIAAAANKYRADMGPGTLADLSGDWCATLKGTKTNGDGMPVGPWLGTCPTAPHAGGTFAVSALTDYTAEITYTYDGKSIKLSDFAGK